MSTNDNNTPGQPQENPATPQPGKERGHIGTDHILIDSNPDPDKQRGHVGAEPAKQAGESLVVTGPAQSHKSSVVHKLFSAEAPADGVDLGDSATDGKVIHIDTEQ